MELDVDRPGSRQPWLEVGFEERDLGALDVAFQNVDMIEPRVLHYSRQRQAETVIPLSSLDLVNGDAVLLISRVYSEKCVTGPDTRLSPDRSGSVWPTVLVKELEVFFVGLERNDGRLRTCGKVSRRAVANVRAGIDDEFDRL